MPAEALPLPHPYCSVCAWGISARDMCILSSNAPSITYCEGNSPMQEEAKPLPHPYCSVCAWGISGGNAPCANTTKNLSGRRRRPCSRRYQSMHYLALACDYDGTLAKDGVVSPRTIDALERVKA